MKAKYEFWKDWKKVTKLEMAAIETVKVTIKKKNPQIGAKKKSTDQCTHTIFC